jgi:uncharacterized RDD family membrane protein YckC
MTQEAPPPVPWAAPVEPTGPAPGVAFAPHAPRLVAYLLDTVVIFVLIIAVSVPAFVLMNAVGGFDAGGPRSPGSVVLISAAWLMAVVTISFLYFPFFWQRTGQTPGMMPFRLWVVRDRDGQPFGWGTALLRVLGMYVASSVFYLGFVWILIDKRHRGWQDLIAGTLVIQRS